MANSCGSSLHPLSLVEYTPYRDRNCMSRWYPVLFAARPSDIIFPTSADARHVKAWVVHRKKNQVWTPNNILSIDTQPLPVNANLALCHALSPPHGNLRIRCSLVLNLIRQMYYTTHRYFYIFDCRSFTYLPASPYSGPKLFVLWFIAWIVSRTLSKQNNGRRSRKLVA